MDCGVHVVATNVVDRPENVHQVLRGDIDQLVSLFQSLEVKEIKPKRKSDRLIQNDILKLYKKLISMRQINQNVKLSFTILKILFLSKDNTGYDFN